MAVKTEIKERKGSITFPIIMQHKLDCNFIVYFTEIDKAVVLCQDNTFSDVSVLYTEFNFNDFSVFQGEIVLRNYFN